MANNSNTMRVRKSGWQHDYKLDVVTDGSEGTDPTVFLTVSRRAATARQEEEAEAHDSDDESSAAVPVARYAVLGLTDMTVRLVTDQKLSWGSTTKAVFCRNNDTDSDSYDDDDENNNTGSWRLHSGGLWGIPGLLLALRQAGTPEVTVVTGNDSDATRVEKFVDLLEVHGSHPRVHICAVPMTPSSSSSSSTAANTATGKEKTAQWWKMYQDEYVTVHATCHQRSEHLIYLFTCRQHGVSPCYTVAVLPSSRAGQVFLDLWSMPENRVVLEMEHGGRRRQQLDISAILTVHNDVSGGNDDADGDKDHLQNFLLQAKALFPDITILLCRPKWNADNGILIRAQQLTRDWHAVLPDYVVCRSQEKKNPLRSDANESRVITNEMMVDLASCTTVKLNQTSPLQVLDRKQRIMQRVGQSFPEQDDVERLKSFLGLPMMSQSPPKTCLDDENEIDIDDDGDGERESDKDENEIDLDIDEDSSSSPQGTTNTQKNSSSSDPSRHADYADRPHLLVLGTGCAAPSPVRGSSGYGLLFPQQIQNEKSMEVEATTREALLLTALIECGEGTLTMLLRHLPSMEEFTKGEADPQRNLRLHLRHIRFIWISHAHWDHYGGLPAVLLAIHNARRQDYCSEQKQKREQQQSNKRVKMSSSLESPVHVIAPTKVLKYLDIALQFRKGFRSSSSQFFRGCKHEQIQAWWPYISSIHISRLRISNCTKPPSNALYDMYTYRPFVFWENVRVDHSCFGAFGFVMGICVPNKNYVGGSFCTGLNDSDNDRNNASVITFAFSGDTRPCWKLVERCHFHCDAVSDRRLSFLLHEASFADSEQEMSVEKKHTSLSEALQVATDTCADRTLLTHFSQRYDKYPPMKVIDDLRCPMSPAKKAAFAMAMDGMIVPLH